MSPHPFLPLIVETLRAASARDILRIGGVADAGFAWPDHTPDHTSSLAPDHTLNHAPAECLDSAAALVTTGRRRADLAIASLETGSNPRQARQLIAVMRDLLARQLLVFVPENLLDDTTLIGLGLSRQARYDINGERWQAWSHDILTYKPAPDWLNPRFWANPENWDKYRW